MSGSLGVPLAVGAYFVPNDIGKILLALTAAACLIFASYRIWAAERLKVVELVSKLDKLENATVADMAIQDVFFYIDADVLENQTFETVGQQILDRLSTGRLKAYGREAHFGVGSYVGFPNLMPIEQSFWNKAEFTYQFFGEDRQNDVHAEPKPPASGSVYRDVRFTSAEVATHWTKSKSSDRIFAMKATYLILTQSEWAKNLAQRPDLMPAQGYEFGKEQKEIIKRRLVPYFHRDLHNRLSAGEIRAWGRTDRDHPMVLIEFKEWQNIQILMDDSDLARLEWGCCSLINPTPGTTRTIIYIGVMFSKTEIFKAYPLLQKPFPGEVFGRTAEPL